VATVRPFRAIRPNKEFADKVISLPYDVMSREEAAEMARGNPFSFLRICRSEIDLPQVEDAYDPAVYEKAKENIEDFLRKGVFLEEAKPMFYIYKQVMDGNIQIGLVGCVSVDDYLNDVIKKHEHTRVEKEQDRIRHFDVCNANTEPVFLTYRDNKKIKMLLEGYLQNNAPQYDFTTGDGVQHTLWTVTDDNVISGLSGLFTEIPCLYIADGHHRSASACKVGQKRRDEHPGYTGEEEFNYFMAVIFPDSHLKVFDYNRVVKDLFGNTVRGFLTKVKEAGFRVEEAPTSPYRPEEKHTFGMYLDGTWYKLTAREEIISSDIVDSLDVAILQDHLLAPILGIQDPRTDNRIDFIGGIRGLEELERRVSQDMQVAFAVHPVDISDLMEVSDQGKVMPPKSTWFEPKLGSGLFLHRL
jgi:uncharacterized protein (DUF1015 family)